MDTGSSWTWFAHDECNTCAQSKADKFDSSRSLTFRQQTPKLTKTVYGKGNILGWNSKDKVCVKATKSDLTNKCTSDQFYFNTVMFQTDLSGLQGAGMIGLAPNSQNSDA